MSDLRRHFQNNSTNPGGLPFRIDPVDGLRAVAVVGVMWAHLWAWCGTPQVAIPIGKYVFDLQRWFSTVGSGVDLFFVISGFCMGILSLKDPARRKLSFYPHFITKRFWRLAPAFFAATLVYALTLLTLMSHSQLFLSTLAHFLFLHIVLPVQTIASHFWSIGTEWQFYLCFPFLVAIPKKQLRFGALFIVGVFSLIHRQWLYSQEIPIQAYWAPQLPARVIEFGWGVVVAHLFHEGRKLPFVLRGHLGFVLSAVIILGGRVLMTTEAGKLAGAYGSWVRAVGEPVMTMGCGLMIWNVITCNTWFSRVLGSRGFCLVGRWSYSIYLWHWIIAGSTLNYLTRWNLPPLALQWLSFIVALSVLLPLSFLSFRWLEKPFLKGFPFSGDKRDRSSYRRLIIGGSLGLNGVLLALISGHLYLRPRLNFVLENVLKSYWGRTDYAPLFPPNLCADTARLSSDTRDRTVFVGDSLTQEANLPKLFPGVQTVNHGLNGDWTDCVLYRIHLATAANPRALVVMIGVNDLNEGRSPEAVAASVGRILATAKSIAPKTRVYLVSLLPTNQRQTPSVVASGVIAETNTKLSTLAPKLGVSYIDAFSALAGSDREIAAENSDDGLHLSPRGYELWARALLPFLKR